METRAELLTDPITKFDFLGRSWKVNYVESHPVIDGVLCATYIFPEDPQKDLAILRIKKGMKTPLQRILEGDLTLEGYLSGLGIFVITNREGVTFEHAVGNRPNCGFSFAVRPGEIMQWRADPDSELVAYEVCYPPYKDGRFENLEE